MKLPNFMKKIINKKQENEEIQPKEKVVNKTVQEIWDIIRSKNFQWENFNKVVDYLQNLIVKTLDLDVQTMASSRVIASKNLVFALSFPWFISQDFIDKLGKPDPELEEMWKSNQVTRVSTDSLRRYVILQALDEILKISSEVEFWDKKYKICDIEINSFDDLEQHRIELENMYEEWEKYEIPWYKEAVEYAAKNQIDINFYS